MNASTPCDRLWRKRLKELDHVWPEFVDGRTAGLHKTRVATRRIREALPIVGSAAPSSKVRKLNKKMRALTRYLGPIRELDVELELLDEKERAQGTPERALEIVRREVAARRLALRENLTDNAPVTDVKKLLRKLERVGKKHDAKREDRWRGVLATRLMRRAKALAAALNEAGALYAPERLHEIRISAKKLRYALEIARDARVTGAAALVRIIKRHQERLGRLHDLQMLLKRVRETEGSAGVGTRVNDLASYAEQLDKECRRLHAAFIERREELSNMVKQVRLQVVPALTTVDKRQARVPAARSVEDAPRTSAR